MTVTDVLRDRADEPSGLERMVALSIAGHATLLVALWLAPGRWPAREAPAPQTVMTISLGGGAGSRSGMTEIGGRPVQEQTPPEEAKRPEAVRAPAARTPDMTLPLPGAKPTKTAPRPVVKEAPDDARGRTPTRGAEPRAGTAIAETGVRGQGFGLSSGGGPGSGSTLDVADFCCPDYLGLMIDRIRSNWNQQQVDGQAIVRFTIERSGQLRDVALEKSSGYPILDLAAQRAVILTRQLPPLPTAFTNPTLTVHLNFQYQR